LLRTGSERAKDSGIRRGMRLAPVLLFVLASFVTGSCCVICVPLHPAEASAAR
jgi:hypothetical protein